jgi:tetratricopeptide (TPR) repeat protein
LLLGPALIKFSDYLVSRKIYTTSFSVYLLSSIFGLSVVVYAKETMHRNEIHKSAADVWTDTVNKNPENPRAHLNAGFASLKMKKIEDAFISFKKAEQLYKRSDQGSLIKYHIGISFFALERYDSSIVYFSKAIELNKNYWDAYVKRGHCYLYLKDFQSAYNNQQTALLHIKDNPDLYMQCAYSLIQLGRNDEAKSIIDSAESNGLLIPSDFKQLINNP